ncbi:MAG TPA: hypothetical protein VIZ22_12930 [Candidatus Limnocylindrales bacterium]
MARRRVSAVFAGVLAGILMLSMASPALGREKPVSERIPAPDPSVFEAGQACPFATEWSYPGKAFLILTTFPMRPNGDQLIRQAGVVNTKITNLESGKSRTYLTPAVQDFLFKADGTIDVTIDGRVPVAYFPTDLGGPAMYLFTGHLHDVVDSSFTLIKHEFKGKSIDLCAVLA